MEYSVCPITKRSSSYSYRFLNCRCFTCRYEHNHSEDPKKKLQRNYKWKRLNPEYRCFENMKKRCNNKNDSHYLNYGGRGIKVLFTSWQEIVEEIGHKPSNHHSIDRIDNDGNYEPGNIRWATMKQQSNNRRARKCQIS